jgi:hypothetical protein
VKEFSYRFLCLGLKLELHFVNRFQTIFLYLSLKNKRFIMGNPLTLTWTEPVLFTDSKFQSGLPGVYLWGYLIDDLFHPYYVGKGVDIFARISQHVSSIMGGYYTIYHKNSLLDFKYHKNVKSSETDIPIKLYHPIFPQSIPDFVLRSEELREHIDFMVSTFAFSYALVEKEYVKYLGEIEKSCISSFGLENLANTRGGLSSYFEVTHEGCVAISSRMNRLLNR